MNANQTSNAPEPVTVYQQPEQPHRRHGIFWPLFLVAAGVVFLLWNLGMLPGATLDTVLRLWPLLFIVGALDGLWRGEGIAWQIFWLGLGVLFLLGNFGYLSLNTWQIVVNYWPLLLVALGIDILFGRRAGVAGRAVSVVLALALLAGLVFLIIAQPVIGSSMTSQALSESLQGATSAEVNLSQAAGEMQVSRGAASGQLVSGNLRTSNMRAIRKDYTVQNGRGVLQLREEGVNVGFNSVSSNYLWDVKLNDTIPTDLTVSLGAGEGNIDLTGLKVTNLDGNLAVGQMTVTLPAGGASGKLSSAVGEIIVRVPRGQAVNIHVSRAITALEVGDGFRQDGNTVTNPNASGTPIDLTVSNAIGGVRVEYAP